MSNEIDLPRIDLTKALIVFEPLPNGKYRPVFVEGVGKSLSVAASPPNPIASISYTEMQAAITAAKAAGTACPYAEGSTYQITDNALNTLDYVYEIVKGYLVLDVTATNFTTIIYSGSGYTYYAKAPVGTARSTAVWQVKRVDDATGDVVFAGTGLFEHDARDLPTVAALTYTLGA